MKRQLKKVLMVIFTILIVCSLTYIFKVYYDIHRSNKEGDLLNNISVNEIAELENQNNANAEFAVTKTERMLKLEELQKENQDIVAWIEIEGTNINYPVLQCQNNEFYMNHNYKKDYSLSGAIFLDKNYNWNPESTNLLIYGHNMINNTMFTNLLNYKSQDYYNAHPKVRFTTNTEDAVYEIFSAFESRTYYKYEENVFRYYYFINANNEAEFNDFVANAKKSSIYDTGKTAVYGEHLMTLSTCAYHTDNGKFVVVAKKIE